MTRIKLAIIYFSVIIFALVLSNSLVVIAKSVDVVLVLDASQTMRASDPNKMALYGAARVIETIQGIGWRFGAVVFDGNVSGTLPLREVTGGKSVADIQADLDSIYHQNGLYTDVPRGLHGAMELYLGGDNVGNERIVIVLNDSEDDPEPGRSAEDIDNYRRAVIRFMSDLYNIKIYTIGLNTNNSFSQEKNELIATETGAQAYEITNSDQIESTLFKILSPYLPNPIKSIPRSPLPATPTPSNNTTAPSPTPESTPPTTTPPVSSATPPVSSATPLITPQSTPKTSPSTTPSATHTATSSATQATATPTPGVPSNQSLYQSLHPSSTPSSTQSTTQSSATFSAPSSNSSSASSSSQPIPMYVPGCILAFIIIAFPLIMIGRRVLQRRTKKKRA